MSDSLPSPTDTPEPTSADEATAPTQLTPLRRRESDPSKQGTERTALIGAPVDPSAPTTRLTPGSGMAETIKTPTGTKTLQVSTRTTATRSHFKDLKPGSVWGDFELIEELGRGGMGVVYRARQSSLNREVALKVMLGGDDEYRQRFQREARALAQVDSANVVKVYFSGMQDGQPYFVMEYLVGTDLSRRIKSGWRPTAAESLGLILQCARGLKAAGDRGIIHRDIKPANLMITDAGVVKLMDFGLVRMTEDLELTNSGVVLGTVHYFSPEQARGHRCDQRSDIYALGVVFYQLLCGKLPFTGDSAATLIYHHVHTPPEPPSRLQPEIPRGHEVIALTCLQKDPSRRYQSAADLVADLERLQGGTFRPPPRGRSRAALVASLGLAAVAAVTVAEVWPSSSKVTPRVAGAPVASMDRSAQRKPDAIPLATTRDTDVRPTPPSSTIASGPIPTTALKPLDPSAGAPSEIVHPAAPNLETTPEILPLIPSSEKPLAKDDPPVIRDPLQAAPEPTPSDRSAPPAGVAPAPQPTNQLPLAADPVQKQDPAAEHVPVSAPVGTAVPVSPTHSVDQPDRAPGLGEVGHDSHGSFSDLVLGEVTVRFRWCAPGTFLMGSPEGERERDSDETQHKVTLTHGFWIADSECTQELWQAVLHENPSSKQGAAQLPVNNVSRADCDRFCQAVRIAKPALHVRLPTEAEWEYACRAGSGEAYSGSATLDSHLACFDTTSPKPVRSYPPNAWGLFDMAGNVSEWCQDTYTEYGRDAAQDPCPGGTAKKGVSRGGFWDDSAGDCRCAKRFKAWVNQRSQSQGMRLVVGASDPNPQKR